MTFRDSLGRFRAKHSRTEPEPTKAPADLIAWRGGDLLDDPSCWISPTGTVYFVHDNGGSHSSTCRRITDSRDGMLALEAKGWLHVSYTSIYEGYDSDRQRSKQPTQAQIDAIFDIAQAAAAIHERRGSHGTNYVTVRFMAWCKDQQEKHS